MNFQTMNRQRKLILISAVIGIISVFLPWFSAVAFGFNVHVNGFHGWGILAFLGFSASVVIALVGDTNHSLEKSMWFAALLCGALSSLAIIIAILSLQTNGGFGILSASLGFGIWIAVGAAAGIVLFGWMYKNPADDVKGGFESLKNKLSASSSSGNTRAASNEALKITEIESLSKLKENGGISEDEFQQLKSKIL